MLLSTWNLSLGILPNGHCRTQTFDTCHHPICVSLTVSFTLSTGITRFDLLGDFGRFNWLGNFYIVLSYNLLFAVVTTLCLVRKFTSAVREALLKALGKTSVPCSCTMDYDGCTILHIVQRSSLGLRIEMLCLPTCPQALVSIGAKLFSIYQTEMPHWGWR